MSGARPFPFARAAWVAGLAAGTVAVLALAILLLGQDPLNAFEVFVDGALRWPSGLGASLARGAILLCYALGVALSFRAGIVNIGAEGQSRIGSAAAVAATLGAPGAFFSAHTALGIPALLLCGAAGGAAWSLIAGLLKRWRGVSEVVSTLMLNFAAMPLVKFLISRHEWLQGDTNFLKRDLPDALQLRGWGGTEFHAWVWPVLLLALAAHYFLFRTKPGMQLRAMGHNRQAARACGVRIEKLELSVFALSGALAGLAGAMSVMAAGVLEAQPPFPDYGYLSISVALVGALSPLWIVPAAILFAAMGVGAAAMEERARVPHWVVFVLHGLLILAILVRSSTARAGSINEEARA